MQRNHDELKIFLKIRLITSQINQELSLQRERTSIYRKVCAKLVGLCPTTWISLLVISIIRSCVIGGIVAHDADSTPCDFNCLIARFNPDRPISLFTPRRHHVGIHVGLRGPAMCLHRATSPPWVPRD